MKWESLINLTALVAAVRATPTPARMKIQRAPPKALSTSLSHLLSIQYRILKMMVETFLPLPTSWRQRELRAARIRFRPQRCEVIHSSILPGVRFVTLALSPRLQQAHRLMVEHSRCPLLLETRSFIRSVTSPCTTSEPATGLCKTQVRDRRIKCALRRFGAFALATG